MCVIFLDRRSHHRTLMVSHWSLSDKSPQVSGTLLSILVDLKNAVVWIVSTRLDMSMSSSPYTYQLVTVTRVQITLGIIVIFMFRRFFNYQAMSRYLSLCSHYFNFILLSTRTTKSIILQVLFLVIGLYHKISKEFMCLIL